MWINRAAAELNVAAAFTTLASELLSDGAHPLRRRLPPLRDATLRLWATQNPSLLPEGLPSHGLLSRRAVEAIAEEAIAAVVVPGLASVGRHWTGGR